MYPYRDTDQHDRAPTEELPGGGIRTVTIRLKFGAVYLLEPEHGIEVLFTINPLVRKRPQ
jgi:hypothetical protein